eukprot:940022-Rhodomonas_salina.2
MPYRAPCTNEADTVLPCYAFATRKCLLRRYLTLLPCYAKFGTEIGCGLYQAVSPAVKNTDRNHAILLRIRSLLPRMIKLVLVHGKCPPKSNTRTHLFSAVCTSTAVACL